MIQKTSPDSLPKFVNVHSLGKFAFCERAGTIAYEMEKEDTEDKENFPRLDYLPIFDLQALDERLKAISKELTMTIVVLVVVALLSLLLLFLIPVLGLGMLFVVWLIARKADLHAKDSREISRRLKEEKAAKAGALEIPLLTLRDLSWWTLAKAEEFNSIVPASEYASKRLGLTGKPARVASYRGVQIPIILHSEDLQVPKPYHVVRLAAYALLLEANSTGKESSCGFILNPNTMRLLAVPIGDKEKSEAKSLLQNSQNSLIATEQNTSPTAPPKSYCEECPYGRPRPIVRGVTENNRHGEISPIRVTGTKDFTKYHSLCGDRFDWAPPHKNLEMFEVKKGKE